jgi:hypothetical protein
MVERHQLTRPLILILLPAILWIGIYAGLWPLSDILSWVPYFIITAWIVVFLWGTLGKKIENALGKRSESDLGKSKTKPYKPDLRFAYLTVHYLRVEGYQDDPDSSRLKCLTDERTKIASWTMPEWLKIPVKEHNMAWLPYYDEKILRKYIKDHYSITSDQLRYEDLKLQLDTKGNLIERKSDKYSELIEKLKDRKLENLQVAYLTRSYPSARRTLLIDFSAKQVWLSPPYDFELLTNGLVTSENYGMWPLESCRRWCKRKFGFPFISQHYPETKLFEGGT